MSGQNQRPGRWAKIGEFGMGGGMAVVACLLLLAPATAGSGANIVYRAPFPHSALITQANDL
jgi:hypothetical protein